MMTETRTQTLDTQQQTAEAVTDRIARLALTDIGKSRMESLALAHPYVDDAVFAALASALRVRRQDTVVLPAHRYEGLSRGRGWARLGSGGSAQWGERVDGGYRVGPGRWTVGGHDGYARKDSAEWTVSHVRVGDQVWTIAS